ncbi:MAG: helix-turn-helix domain-containing protein [Candidatus Nomurabacteria bacterium]|jgi:excisionase family DNA binding protein|nr:helix-turn-helix domain-containing protein [Candidatus Nomurabacteria bacterium]
MLEQHISQKKRQKSLGAPAKARQNNYIEIEQGDDLDMSEVTLLSMKQVMGYLNVSQWIYYKLVNSRQLPTVIIGGRRLVRLKSLKEYLESVETRKKGMNDFF